MKIAIGSDEKTKTTDALIHHLKSQNHAVVLFGALTKPKANWVDVAEQVALAVKNKEVDEGIIFCWTGTGVAMVASKFPGIRAVNVTNQKTAKEARAWDHANILALSCFLPVERVVKIIEVWLKTPYSDDPEDLESIKKIERLEKKLYR